MRVDATVTDDVKYRVTQRLFVDLFDVFERKRVVETQPVPLSLISWQELVVREPVSFSVNRSDVFDCHRGCFGVRKSRFANEVLRFQAERAKMVGPIAQLVRRNCLKPSVNIAKRACHDHREPHDLPHSEGGAVVQG